MSHVTYITDTADTNTDVSNLGSHHRNGRETKGEGN